MHQQAFFSSVIAFRASAQRLSAPHAGQRRVARNSCEVFEESIVMLEAGDEIGDGVCNFKVIGLS